MATTGPHAAPGSPEPPPLPPGPRNTGPLVWIVLLLVLLAFGWFVYRQRWGDNTTPDTPPPAIDSGDGRDEAVERERSAAEPLPPARREAGDAKGPRSAPIPAPATGPDRAPVPLLRIDPDYPLAAYRAREEGTVLVAVTVDPRGRPHDARVVRRSGSRELDAAALDAVARWTFEPAIRDGRATSAEVQVPVTFRIER